MGMIHMHEKIHNELRKILILMKQKNELGYTFSDAIQYLITHCESATREELNNISNEDVQALKEKMRKNQLYKTK